MENDFKETIASEETEQDDGKLTPEEQKFLDMLDEGRPAPLEYDDSPAESASDESLSEPKGRAVLKILAYTVFLVAVILGVYYFFPKPHKVKKSIENYHSIDELPVEVFADEHYGSILRDALDAYFKGDYTKCVETIHPHLDEITEERKNNMKALDVLSLYIHTLRFANLSPTVRREAVETLSKLSFEEPDNAAWHIALMRIIYKDILDYSQIFEQSKAKISNWRGLLARCNDALDVINSLEKSQRQKIATSDDDNRPRLRRELVDILALQCAIYTSKWILEGGEGKSSLPDDEGDRGVASREQAVRIAMSKDADCGKFKETCPDLYDARHFIATTVKAQGNGLFNSYFWNGTKYVRITPLQREINNTAAKLSKLKKSRTF